MKELASVIEALGKLAWPILAAIITYKFLPILTAIVKSRSFTVKVGEMEVSVQEASEQIRGDMAIFNSRWRRCGCKFHKHPQ
jgi:hypothetical protein